VKNAKKSGSVALRGKPAYLSCLAALAVFCAMPTLAGAAIPIHICSIDDRSGASAELGIESSQGLQVAVDEANATGGIGGRKIEIIAYDGKTDAQLSATFVARCAEDDKGLVIIGGNPSGPAAAMLPITAEYKIPFFSMAAGTDNMTEPASPYHFRFGPANRQDALAIAELLQKQGFKRIALIFNSLPFGADAARAVTAELRKRNITVILQQAYDVNAADVTPQVVNVRNAKPDAVVVFPYPADGARVMRTMRQLDVQAPTVVWRTALMSTFRKLSGDASDGIVVPNTIDTSRPDVKAFFATLDARYGEQPQILFPVLGYDAGKVALQVMSQPQVLKAIDTGDIQAARTAFRDAVERIGKFKGLQGHVQSAYQFGPGRHHGPPDSNWFFFTQVADKGRSIVAPNYATFIPKSK
jgi:branched-chain amino acid transport system substrate-binding protein